MDIMGTSLYYTDGTKSGITCIYTMAEMLISEIEDDNEREEYEKEYPNWTEEEVIEFVEGNDVTIVDDTEE